MSTQVAPDLQNRNNALDASAKSFGSGFNLGNTANSAAGHNFKVLNVSEPKPLALRGRANE